MRRPPSRSMLLLSALILMIAANAIVLSGVTYNRGGTPEAQVVLTERELKHPYRIHAENSGLALRLTWRVLTEEEDRHTWRSSPAWLTPAKLQTLGFDLPDAPGPAARDANSRSPLPREVYIVLEQDGPLYQQALERATAALATARGLAQAHPENEELRKAFEAAQKRFRHEQIAASRLFAVDAGTDSQSLRRTYPNRKRFIIATGLVRAGYEFEDGHRRIRGTISRLVIESIHVPLAHRRSLDAILDHDRANRTHPSPPRYAVELFYGRRFEPWIVAVQPALERRSPGGS